MNATDGPIRILILGGGFGGIRTALNLAKKKIPNTRIVLVSDKHHFDYTPALYKLATGASPLETCIPLGEIFQHTNVEVLVDTITGGSLPDQVIFGKSGSRYQYDFLVLGLGAETAYFNIPGVAEHSFALKSVGTALKLKNHVHALFDGSKGLSKEEMMCRFQFVVVGGGPAGVELASVIRRYTRTLAKMHTIPEHLITVDMVQAVPRLLPTFPEEVSRRVTKKLSELGINIMLGRAVTGEDADGVYLNETKLQAKTVIWTAGVRASHIYGSITGLTLDKGGRIVVDEYMNALNTKNVFAIGDSASTPHAGTAQTANYDGSYIPRVIEAIIQKKSLPKYEPRVTPYVIPVGSKWGIFSYKNTVLSGRVFRWLREVIDFRFFLSILPLGKAFNVWREGGSICESCPTCEEAVAISTQQHLERRSSSKSLG